VHGTHAPAPHDDQPGTVSSHEVRYACVRLCRHAVHLMGNSGFPEYFRRRVQGRTGFLAAPIAQDVAWGGSIAAARVRPGRKCTRSTCNLPSRPAHCAKRHTA